jgi:hypothetical protein
VTAQVASTWSARGSHPGHRSCFVMTSIHSLCSFYCFSWIMACLGVHHEPASRTSCIKGEPLHEHGPRSFPMAGTRHHPYWLSLKPLLACGTSSVFEILSHNASMRSLTRSCSHSSHTWLDWISKGLAEGGKTTTAIMRHSAAFDWADRVEIFDLMNWQDWEVCELTQQGMTANAYLYYSRTYGKRGKKQPKRGA